MIIFAATLFFGSLIGIAALFGVKYWEVRAGRVVAPGVRTRADAYALQLKDLLHRSRGELAKVPPMLLYMSRIAVHEAALGAAQLARAAERGAHRLADMVSHKHRFERREPRSEYLKQMNDHKNNLSE
ncbi:MAG: hypothetical protein WC050_00250 [Candidatus Paceibacterota bacterium]